MSRERRLKPKPKAKPRRPEKLKSWAEIDDAKKAKLARLEVDRKVQELRNLSRHVSNYVKQQDSMDGRLQNMYEAKMPSEVHESQNLKSSNNQDHNVSTFDPKNESLFTSVIELPSSIQNRLGLAVKYLVSKEYQNWPMVLHQLKENGGFKDLPEKDIRILIYCMPKAELASLFPLIESLLLEANIAKSPKIINQYLRSLILGRVVSDEHMDILQRYISELRSTSKHGILSRDSYEILIEAYGKRNSLDRVDEVIKEMRAHLIQPSFNVYSNVLTTCVYKSRDHKQAVQLFDLMKFLAGSMSPKSLDYQNIIVSYVNNNDVEKALDLYQEMIDKKLEFTQSMIVALARGCMSRPTLKYKAWDFIFEIYRMKWEPTVPTLEYILYLCAKDGDLTLARAVFNQLNILNATSPRSFGFLMLAYANSAVAETVRYKVPTINFHDKGKIFRTNMLDKTDFSVIHENPKQAVPFLPILALTTVEQLLSESSAIMAHALLVNKEFATKANMNTYLNIAAEFGSLEGFKDRYNDFTRLDTSGIPETETGQTVVEDDVSEFVESEIASLSKEETSLSANTTKSPILSQILQTSNFKIPRNTTTYTIALKAASRHKNYLFSQKVWRERGMYRKSDNFKSLNRQQKDELDFAFATSMVHCLTEMKLLDDALAILVSTEYQFKWTWKQLSKLHVAAVKMGYEKVSKTVRGIANRAQVKYEGKIRRKDFKKFTLQRGY